MTGSASALLFSWRGAVLAAAVMSFPLMVRAIRLALEGWTSNWSKRREPSGPAAGGYFDHYVAVDSAGDYCRHGAGLRPLVREFGATITFVSNIPGETRTLPSAMYTLIQTPGGEGAAARLCLIAIGLALVSLLISEWLARVSRQRMGG